MEIVVDKRDSGAILGQLFEIARGSGFIIFMAASNDKPSKNDETTESRLHRWQDGLEMLIKMHDKEEDPVKRQQLAEIIAQTQCL